MVVVTIYCHDLKEGRCVAEGLNLRGWDRKMVKLHTGLTLTILGNCNIMGNSRALSAKWSSLKRGELSDDQ
jgi:hypothetical protein